MLKLGKEAFAFDHYEILEYAHKKFPWIIIIYIKYQIIFNSYSEIELEYNSLKKSLLIGEIDIDGKKYVIFHLSFKFLHFSSFIKEFFG